MLIEKLIAEEKDPEKVRLLIEKLIEALGQEAFLYPDCIRRDKRYR